MPAVELRKNIHWIGVNDHTTDLFEGLWPITQEGVSYNSYLINDQKKAIIDLAKSIKVDQFFKRIAEIIDPSQVDYIILNHMEPDHTGVLRVLRKIAPHATILCSSKAKDMIQAFYGITDQVQIVQDGEEVELGGLTLQFFMTPFVHWPETMMTFEKKNRILFSCDAFGSYGALRGAIFDDECTDLEFYKKQALRYYANIVAKFSAQVLKAIEKLAGIPVEVIAPSHGLIWRKNPSIILNLYKKWAEYAKIPGEPGITLLYATMYGNTEALMDSV
ncbi:MAG: MBL fold metallo-hydrolase, partial [Candidatus Atribacteria bacterium]|nr:MBL fold metallo-hydrolase [Candidatus Atribacteria bacterium]